MSILNWDVHDRPREKLMQYGPKGLTDAELLAIFLRVGVQGKSAVALAQELIDHFGSLHQLLTAPQDQFSDIKGMGNAKFCQLQAVFEMSQRALADNASQNSAIQDMAALKDLIHLQLHNMTHERCIGLFLDPSLRLIHIEVLSEGGLIQAHLNTRQIAQHALNHNAHALILAHNHPNGSNQPSDADIQTTFELHDQLQPLGVHLIDHFIIAQGHPPLSMVEQSFFIAS